MQTLSSNRAHERARRAGAARIAARAAVIVLLALIIAFSGAASARLARADEASSSSASNTEETPSDRQSRRDAITRFEAFLEKYPQSATRVDVLFTLADLYADEEIEAALAASSSDGAGLDSVSHTASIRCLSEIAERFPTFARREETLYRLGYLRADARDDGAASSAFDTLIREYPSGAFAASARVRLAEIDLRRGDFAGAAGAFCEALAYGADARAEEVHYRLAWALYRSREFTAARDALVDGIRVEEEAGADPEIGLLREMIHLLAVIAAATPGTADAEAIARRIDPAPRRVFLSEVGDILLEEDRAAESVRFFDGALAQDVSHDRAPALAQAAIEASVSAEPRERAAARMIEFASTFAAAGEWRRARSLSDDESVRVDALCEENIYRGGALLYEAARDSAGNPALAARAEAALVAAVEAYPRAAGVDDARFLLGELARAGERWSEAAEFYSAARVDRVSPTRREPLLFGRVLALEGARQAAAARGEAPARDSRGDAAAIEIAIAAREIAAIDGYLTEHADAAEAARLTEKRADLLAITGAHEAAADAYARLAEGETKGSPRARELAAKRGAALVGAEKPSEAAAAFEEAAAPEQAAAALYEAAERSAGLGRADAAGLELFALCARYSQSSVAFAAALDGVEFLASAERYDTLAVCAANLSPQTFAGAGQADSLRHVLAAAAARAESENAPAAASLFEAAARFGQGPEVAAALVRAADLETSRGGAADATIALLERARLAAARGGTADSAAVLALRAGIARRLGAAFARMGKERDCVGAYDDAIAIGARSALGEPALDREVALAAIEKADILRASFEKRAPNPALTVKEAQRLRKDAAAICEFYTMAAARTFRDLTPRACVCAAEVTMNVSRTIFARGLAKEDASLLEEARLAAASASSYRAAAAALKIETGSEWASRLDAIRSWRAAPIAAAIAHADSVASLLSANAGGETAADPKQLARAIVRLSDLSRLLDAVGGIADAPDAGVEASASLALRRGALHEEMIMLLLAAPLPGDLDEEARVAYANGVEERVASWRGDALEIYRAEITRANARAAATVGDATSAQPTPSPMIELNRRAARLEDALEINSSLTRRP